MGAPEIDELARLLAQRGLRVQAVGSTQSRKLIVANPAAKLDTIVTTLGDQYAATFERGEPPESLGTDNPATAADAIARMLAPAVMS